MDTMDALRAALNQFSETNYTSRPTQGGNYS